MSYFSSVERPVFISFLNREAVRASQAVRSEEEDICSLDALTICHCCGMTANLSQMFEYSHEKPRLRRVIEGLIKGGVLESTSHSTNLDEFISSRQAIYEKVRDSYPMYFEDNSELERFPIIKRNTFSMTKLLRRDIFDFDATKFPLLGKHVIEGDVRKFGEAIGEIRTVVYGNPEVAITKGNIEKLANSGNISKANLDATGRVFSARYFDHYKENNGAAIPTGVGMIGFLDDLSHFPTYDVPVLNKLLSALGWAFLNRTVTNLRDEVMLAYGNSYHQRFVQTVNSFVAICFKEVLRTSNVDPESHDSTSTLRRMTGQYVSSLIDRSMDHRAREHVSLVNFYENSIATIQLAIRLEADSNPNFANHRDEHMGQTKMVKILFLTATDAEDDAVRVALEARGFKFVEHQSTGSGVASVYERGAERQAVHVRSSAGSTGSSGSELTAYDAFRATAPNYTIAVGICFGLKPDKPQKLGDILVSERVTDYEMTRVGQVEIRERGVRIDSGAMLLSASRSLRSQYSQGEPNVYHGEILSGMKLVDSERFSSDLATRFRDAIGGEMEGMGIASSASRIGTNWIVVKAICDWAKGKTDSAHGLAAKNAAEYSVRLAEIVYDVDLRVKKDG